MQIEDRYRISNCVGTGSFGAVYAAQELLCGEIIGHCALKLFKPQSPEELRSVLREVRLTAHLSHPHIMPFRGSAEIVEGPLEGCVYLATELAEESLYGRLGAGEPLPLRLLLEIVRDVADALEYMHHRRLIHRDVTPDNILRLGDVWKLSDLGLCLSLEEIRRHGVPDDGTTAYMAPELLGKQAGTSVDLWALGVVVQECLTGSYPYRGNSAEEYLESLRRDAPRVFSGLPEPFEQIVQGCLRVDSGDRLTAGQVLELCTRVW
ncbi:MAG: serine/threonine protein kinase [Armatimonadetes bacterium]|nr:serine/threonine protein kinase [Armatimonadota bacterium]